MLRRVLILALLLVTPMAADKKTKGAPLAKLPEQKVDVPNLMLPAAGQPCTNYAWAAVVEAMLKMQSVSIDQHFWVQKANGGELCIDPLPNLERLVRTLTGSYILMDGTRVKLQAQLIVGAPTIPDDAIAPLKHGVPLLVFWKSRAYIMQGAVYDEYIYPNGQRMYQLRELKMLDPLAPVKSREVSFVNGTDDPEDIAGLVSVTATPVPPGLWQSTGQWQNISQWKTATKWQ
jgi:hypothetical protein